MDILSSKAGGVLTIEFNRPERKNAITSAMYQSMADAINDGEQDAAVRAILIVGKPEIFTAGNDLEDFMKTSRPADGAGIEERAVFRFMMALSGATKPVVAAVAGAAVGIGTTMLLHCDLVYAAPNTRLQLPFVNLGLVPEAASSLLLPALIGYQRAAELLLLGEPFTAQRAKEIGLVTEVVPEDQLFD